MCFVFYYCSAAYVYQSRRFGVEHLWSLMCKIKSTFSFAFISSCLMVLDKIIFNRTEESGNPCLICDFPWNILNFSSFNIKLSEILLYFYLYYAEIYSQLPRLSRTFITKLCWIYWKVFSIYNVVIMWSLSLSLLMWSIIFINLYMLKYTYIVKMESTCDFLMCSWIWFKCILLIFFGIHVHQEYWSRLLCVSLSGIKCTTGFIERIWNHSFFVFFLWNNLRKIAFSSFLKLNLHKGTGTTQYLVPCIFYLLKDLPRPTDGCQRESWMHGTFPKTSSISEFAVFWHFKDSCFLQLCITSMNNGHKQCFTAARVALDRCWVGKGLMEKYGVDEVDMRER